MAEDLLLRCSGDVRKSGFGLNATDIGHTAITGIVKATHQSVTKPEKKAEKAAEK